jgi:superfamily II DNA or RNA helicase
MMKKLDIDAFLQRLPKVDSRAYQRRIVGKAFDLFAIKRATSVLIESPTGSGKTVMALMCAKLLQDYLDLRVGWVSMRKHLLAQASQENIDKDIRASIEFFSMYAKEIPKGIDLLIVDEAQHDAASSMAHIHNEIQPRFTLGMTATPFRCDRLKLCFDSVLKDAGIHRLIQEGFLSQYHHFTIADWSPERVTKHYLMEPNRWGKSLMYFHRLDQCAYAQQLLFEGGVPCEVVSGETDVDRQLEWFRKGKLQVLINCMKLTEGFDSPDLQTVFCRPSNKGTTMQMCGRAFRKHPDLAIKNIVQAERTRWPFIRTATPQRKFVFEHGEWLSIEGSDRIEIASLNVVTQMAGLDIKLPKVLAKYNSEISKELMRKRKRADGPPSEAAPAGDEKQAAVGAALAAVPISVDG